MPKSLILVVGILLTLQLDGWSQVGAAGAIKNQARGVAGRNAPAKTGQPGAGGSAGSSTQRYRPVPTRIPDRTKTPIRQIESAFSSIKYKQPLTDVHREKLAVAMVAAGAASGAKVKPETITKVAYDVANAVNAHKPGYSSLKRLAATLWASMGAAGFDADQTKFYLAEAKYSFADTKAPAKKIEAMLTGINQLMAEQKKTVSK